MPDAADPATQTNKSLVDELRRTDMIVIVGETLSHRVAHTVRHLADDIGEDNIRKLALLTDCASPVSGFAPGRVISG